MFDYQEDVQLYWINGQTFEMPINYELVGTLMGIAIYNNTFIDLPFPSAAYKLLLDEKPTMDDLAQWQPEVANSFYKHILEYDAKASGAPLEDVLCRTFTATVE